MRRARTPLLVAAAVALTILAHPPFALWPVAFAMLAPLVAALEAAPPGRGFALGHLYTVGMGLGVVRWLVHALSDEYGVPRPPAWAFTAALLAVLAVVPGAAAALYCWLRPRVSLALAPVLFAAAWVLGEWVRGALLGVPWVLLGHAVHRLPVALQVADLGGAWAVGFTVAAANAGLALALSHRRVLPLAPALALLVLAGGYGASRLGATAAGPRSARVGVIQAAFPPAERFGPGTAFRNAERQAAMTRALLGQGPLDLVVWAETAVDGDIDATPGLRERLTELVDGLGTPLVTGAARSSRGRPTNSVVLVAPGAGLLESYAKQRLVPFSEYDPPLAGILAPLLGPLMQGIPYEAGREPTVLRRGPIPLGAPVCFEITYPNLVRAFRMRGAELVLNLSNDAWFGRTGYPEMHLAHAVLRAVEFRTWVVRAANTGISAVVDPSGRVVDELPIFEPGTLTARVHPAGPPPLYARAGDGPVLLVLGAVLAAAATGRLRR